ncbi:hypothetical protein KR038_010587, partial [Drosophila bunnanda]
STNCLEFSVNMWNWGKQLWKRKSKNKESYVEDPTENELWQEYYAPYLHFLPFKEVCSRMETSLTQGLTKEVAALRLERRGKNILPIPPKRVPLIVRYLRHCFGVVGCITLLGSLTCFYLHHQTSELKRNENHNPKHLAAGWSLLIIFLLAGLMPVLHEYDEQALLEAIDETMPMYCTVIRDGKKEIILTEDVVIGDVLPISFGQRLPADLRFFSTLRLEVDKVALSGSSNPWEIFLLASDEKHMFKHSRIEYTND